MAGIKSFVLYENCSENDGKMRRGTFLLNMARDLVMNQMKTRVYNERLSRELSMTISRVLGKDPAPPVVWSVPQSVRKLCSICPTKKKGRRHTVAVTVQSQFAFNAPSHYVIIVKQSCDLETG